MRQQLRKIGSDAKQRTSADFPSWAERIANHDFDITTDNVWNWGDPVIGVHRTFLSSNIRNVVWTNTQSRSEEHTSELQSRGHLVCRLLLEKKKKARKFTPLVDQVIQ